MFVVYDILLHLALVVLMPVFLYRMASRSKYRAGLAHRMGNLPPEIFRDTAAKRPIWLHCVSVGESIAAVPLAKALKERHPEIPLVVSTVTDTGQRVVREKMPFADAVFYLPLDLSWVARKVVSIVNPRLFVVVETEIWPNLFREMQRRDVPIVVVNGRISDRSAGRYRAAGFFMRPVLEAVSAFGMQSPLDAQRIVEAGAEEGRVVLTGNVKFDQAEVSMDSGALGALRRELGVGENEKLFLAGSTHEGEEAVILDVFSRLRERHQGLVLLLAHRHPERLGRVEDILREKGLPWVRRTAASGRRAEPVILLDTMGELGRLYAVCHAAFVGGSLVDVGGHNLLEPAAWGRPVLFGPHTHNFREITEKLLAAGGGVRVADAAEVERVLDELLDHGKAAAMGQKGRRVVDENRGALMRTVEMVERFL